MQEVKAPDFFQYLDENGKMRADAPESAKKAFRAWKRDNPMRVSTNDLIRKRGLGLPMDDLKKHLKEHKEKLKQEEQAKKN